MEKEVLDAKEIADDVQQTFDNVSNEYRQMLEDRINEYCASMVIKYEKTTNFISKGIVEIFGSFNNKYQNKIAPKAGNIYNVIIQKHREFEIVEGTALYDNKGWLDPKTKELIVKVIAWK